MDNADPLMRKRKLENLQQNVVNGSGKSYSQKHARLKWNADYIKFGKSWTYWAARVELANLF